MTTPPTPPTPESAGRDAADQTPTPPWVDWDYRLVREPGGPTPYSVRRVFYDEDERAVAWSAEPLRVVGASVRQLARELASMRAALDDQALDGWTGEPVE